MKAPTHSVFGIFFALMVLSLFGITLSLHWSVLLIALIGAILPDIDNMKSRAGSVFLIISKPLERKFGHRTITHSLLGWLLATLLFAIFIVIIFLLVRCLLSAVTSQGKMLFDCRLTTADCGLLLRWIAAFSLGYISHLILDMFKPRGVQLFWPDPTRDVIFKNARFKLESGSRAEIIIFIILFFFMLLTLPISNYGLMTSFRWILSTPESVIQEFKNSNTRLYLDFDGTFNTTKTPIEGRAEVLDTKGNVLIVQIIEDHTPFDYSQVGEVYSLSDGNTTDIMTNNLKFFKTQEAVKYETKKIANLKITDLAKSMPDSGLISGIIYLPKNLIMKTDKANIYKEDFKSITQDGNKLTLTFATKQDLKNLTWEETYFLKIKQKQAELNTLKYELSILKKELADQTSKLDKSYLELQKNEKELKIKELELDLKNSGTTLTGEVVIRE